VRLATVLFDVVIQVGEEKGQVLEEALHEALEGLCRIMYAKRHEALFEQA
jgi:hypothetical protein